MLRLWVDLLPLLRRIHRQPAIATLSNNPRRQPLLLVLSLNATLQGLVEALLPDPFYLAITEDFQRDLLMRKEVLARYFDISLREARSIGKCVTVPGHPELGAAAWLIPQSTSTSHSEELDKPAHLANLLGPRGLTNYFRIIDFMSPLAASSVPGDAWYLSIVGVSPATQGQGVGKQLLRPTLEQASEESAICYLETFNARNNAFYERLGFYVVATHQEPVTGRPYSIMRRNPYLSRFRTGSVKHG